MIRLYKDGDIMAITSNELSEERFIQELSVLLEHVIDTAEYAGDLTFQLEIWLPQIVDICCRYRGYDSSVTEQVTICAGQLDILERKDIIAERDLEETYFVKKKNFLVDGVNGTEEITKEQ